MIPQGELFTNLGQDFETQNPQQVDLDDEEAFVRLMDLPLRRTRSQDTHATPPPSADVTRMQHAARTPSGPNVNVNQPTATNENNPRKRKRSNTQKRTSKSRGKNRPRFALHHPKQLQFNELGQAVAPADKVAQFSRYLGQIAADCSNFPLDTKNWNLMCKSGKVENAWETVKGALDWSEPETVKLQDDIKELVIEKLHDRWKAFKCRMKNKWYKPYVGTEDRFTCGNMHVHPDQWVALVARWDNTDNQKIAKINVANRNQSKMPHATGTTTFARLRYEWGLQHIGETLDRLTFINLAYKSTKKDPTNPEPVNEEAQLLFDEIRESVNQVESDGQQLTPEVQNEVFYKVMGPERRNRVRGYGVGVKWVDVPGTVHVKQKVPQQIQVLQSALEEQRETYEEKQAESAERERALLAKFQELSAKFDAMQQQIRGGSTVMPVQS